MLNNPTSCDGSWTPFNKEESNARGMLAPPSKLADSCTSEKLLATHRITVKQLSITWFTTHCAMCRKHWTSKCNNSNDDVSAPCLMPSAVFGTPSFPDVGTLYSPSVGKVTGWRFVLGVWMFRRQRQTTDKWYYLVNQLWQLTQDENSKHLNLWLNEV